MKRSIWVSWIVCAGVLLIPLGGASVVAASQGAVPGSPMSAPGPSGQAPGAPQAPADTPFTLVSSGVLTYTIADPKVFWYAQPPCQNPPPPAPSTNLYETIHRIATYGGLERKLYSHQINSGTDLCPNNVDVLSNIVSDGTDLYWISHLDAGLVKLSVNANVGDKPAVLNTTWGSAAELALAKGVVYVLTEPGNSILFSVDASTGKGSLMADAGVGSADLQADGTYVFWNTNGTLHQWDIASGKELSTIASGVTGYHPAGTDVYYGHGRTLHRFNNSSRTAGLIYTSADSTARIYSLAFDNNELFWLEDHTLACVSPCLAGPPHDDYLFRSGAGGGSPTQIHVFHAGTGPQASHLRADKLYLFWLENGPLLRLPEDASALPDINLVSDGLEVTQGVQYKNNTVLLIQNRTTWVRFYVHSAGAAVPGVTAWLYRTNSMGNIIDGPVLPANPAGGLLTVLPSPRRNNLNDSFLFELPWTWTSGSTLHLAAVMNPNQYPLEPNYADDGSGLYSFNLQPAPAATYYVFEWGYRLNGKTYYPTSTDLQLNLSWLRRAYPLDSIPGWTSGFQVIPDIIFDAGLGSRVNQTSSECSSSLCASQYINTQEQSMRDVWPIDDTVGIYGLISDVAGLFPRGQECCGTRVASGPAGLNVDGYYGGHEMGHTLGRSHPSSSATLCGNSASDNSYPWPNGQIGPSNGSLEGFDGGDTAGLSALGLSLAIYPGAKWTDVMTYCPNEWISDYTYTGMYSYMIANPPAAPAGPSLAWAAPSLIGNYLAVTGEIVTPGVSLQQRVPGFRATATGAVLSRVRHLAAVARIPPLVAGPYSLELYDAGNHQLASYPFTPLTATVDAPNLQPFNQVVNFVAGSAQLRVVRLADSAVLATQAIPPHSPTLSNVMLVGAPNPVAGTVTLQWTAGDADGNPLTFDIYYSRDGGASTQPLQLGVSGSSAQLDTSPLAGSSNALFRVIASDGVNTAQADSPTFSMANKPPQPEILTPGDGAHYHWGQLVNFSGDATDAQDGYVSPSKLSWSDQAGALGNGALLSVSDLPVGSDVITLTATDSASQKASMSITVIVDDDLDLPGPILSIGPQQFGFSFTSSDSPAQTDQLTLDNVGGGSLSWTASTDASWLKLDVTSGTTPGQINLTADPTGMATGTERTGHLFLNAVGVSPAQQVVVPVKLDVGVSTSAPPPPPLLVYLPLGMR